MTIPGSVDAHVHLKDPAGIAAAAAAGVVALRDAGTRNGVGLRAPLPAQPLLISAGWALTTKGGYGASFGTAVGSRQETKAEILKLRSAGAGIIKIMASGMVSLKEPGTITPGGFSAEDMRYIVEEAGQHGLGVMAHANGETAIRNAAEAGVRSIEHGFFMTEDALASLLASRVFWVPTVGALMRASETPGVPPGIRDFVAATVKAHLEMVRRAFLIGVPLAVGTDCMLPDPHYREAYETELAYFQQAGIPGDDVRRIACEGGAKLLGTSS